VVEAAQLFHKLMQRLGFTKYYTQGGDWGKLEINTVTLVFDLSFISSFLNIGALITTAMGSLYEKE